MVATRTRTSDQGTVTSSEALTLTEVGNIVVLNIKTQREKVADVDQSHVSFRVEAGLSPAGAAIRLSVLAPDLSGRPRYFDAFLDPMDLASLQIFQILMSQDGIQVCFQDQEGKVIQWVQLSLSQPDRSEFARTVMRAIAHDLKRPHVDFQEAKRAVMRDKAI